MGRQLTRAWSQALEDAKDPVTKAVLSNEDVNAWIRRCRSARD
jgi:hypothetical protein